jgi:hypothetical protein
VILTYNRRGTLIFAPEGSDYWETAGITPEQTCALEFKIPREKIAPYEKDQPPSKFSISAL